MSLLEKVKRFFFASVLSVFKFRIFKINFCGRNDHFPWRKFTFVNHNTFLIVCLWMKSFVYFFYVTNLIILCKFLQIDYFFIRILLFIVWVCVCVGWENSSKLLSKNFHNFEFCAMDNIDLKINTLIEVQKLFEILGFSMWTLRYNYKTIVHRNVHTLDSYFYILVLKDSNLQN